MSKQEELIEVEMRLGGGGKLDFFGVDEVNEQLKAGKVVKGLEKGRALMTKVGESEESVRVKFEGFSILVVLGNE